MRRPPKKDEKRRRKQTLVINLSIAVLITFIVSIVLFDTLKPEKIDRTYTTEVGVKAQSQEIPRKKTKIKRKRQVRNTDYKKYQGYFDEKDGLEDTAYNSDGVWAAE